MILQDGTFFKPWQLGLGVIWHTQPAQCIFPSLPLKVIFFHRRAYLGKVKKSQGIIFRISGLKFQTKTIFTLILSHSFFCFSGNWDIKKKYLEISFLRTGQDSTNDFFNSIFINISYLRKILDTIHLNLQWEELQEFVISFVCMCPRSKEIVRQTSPPPPHPTLTYISPPNLIGLSLTLCYTACRDPSCIRIYLKEHIIDH